MADFNEFCNNFWCNIIKLFQIDKNKTDQLNVTPKIKLNHDDEIGLERNVDKVAMLLESIMTGAENLDAEAPYCPVKPGFVKDLVEGAKGSAN